MQRVGLAIDVVIGEEIEMVVVVVIIAKIIVDISQSVNQWLAVEIDLSHRFHGVHLVSDVRWCSVLATVLRIDLSFVGNNCSVHYLYGIVVLGVARVGEGG